MRRRILGAALGLVLLAATARAEPRPNQVILRLETPGAETVQATVDALSARLDRFGLAAEVRALDGERIRVRLGLLEPGQDRQVLRLLTSPGRVDLVDLAGEVVVEAKAVRGLSTTLVDGRVRFRLRLEDAPRKAWASAPTRLALRWDGRPIHYFARTDSPVVLFPEAYPREDLRCLFCCVLHGPLASKVEVDAADLGAVSDPELAWRGLTATWKACRPALAGVVVYGQGEGGATYTASTTIVTRDDRTLYRIEDRLDVPGHPERSVRFELLCAPDWSLVEGRIVTGGQAVVLEPKETFLGPGVLLRVAPLLPNQEGLAFGPGGRVRIRTGSVPGSLEVVSSTPPISVAVRGEGVQSFVLAEGDGPFLRVR